MKYALLFLLSLVTPVIAETWPLERVDAALLVRGTAKSALGAGGSSLVLDGESLIELKDSAKLGSGTFTVSLWFNPYEPTAAQQVLAGKNRYSRNERQWSLTIEPNGLLKAHLQQDGWSTISCTEALMAGGWHWVTLVVEPDKAALFLNGEHAGDVKLKRSIAATDAPITLGGIWDAGGVHQAFHGALDECSVVARALTAEEIAASYKPVSNKHDITPQVATAGLPLWDATQTLPKAAELPVLTGARFSVIKPYEFNKDGYRFLHGVALCFHKGRLYASFGHNKGGENTDTEEARFCMSEDDGKTWSEVRTVDAGDGPVGVSHGAFLSHNGTLWAFQGAYTGTMKEVHTRAYVLDETTRKWMPKGTVIEGGFWPMQEPQKMDDGNWIMAGLKVGEGDPAIVAVSHGEDFTQWDMVPIPQAKDLRKMWGESTVIVNGNRITSISRYGGKADALTASSEDYGRTWTEMRPSNLPMSTSKPIAGMLSTGQRYLVCTTTADSGKRRAPLTIAVSKPGETLFSKVFVIRDTEFPGGPGESNKGAALSYPYSVEHAGKLYVGYSNSGDKSTRVGTGRELWNNNSAELAVIPVASLSTTALHAAEPVYTDLTKRTWQGIPGLERTAKGRIFVSWFTGGTKEPEPENTVVLSQSDDGGNTFSAPQAMGLPLNDGTRCYDPCLWIDPKGRLWYLLNRSVKDSTKYGVYARICDAPDAPEPVWGAEFRVGFDSPFSFRMNKPTVLSSGEWVLPVVHSLEALAGWAGFDPKQVFGSAISTDEGKTWKLHGEVRTPKAGLENMIVELKDGRLWMLIRTEKVLWESHSSDKGRTWTEGKPTTIATPHSRFFIRRLSSGNLLLVNHYKFTGRSHLTAQLSTDDGATWNEGLPLDERSGVSYPDGVQEKDGLIWITYDRDRGGTGEILLAKFKEEDVVAGKSVSGAVSLRQEVNKLNKPALKVTQQLLNSIHVTPKLNFDPMPAYGQKYLPFAMAASMESTQKGRLWTCWAGGQDGPNAYLLASYSDDQGKSWRDPVFVIDPQAQGLKMGTRLGSFWCDPKGRLWLFFHQSVGMFDGSCSNWFVRCDNPDAEKPVWTEPVYIGFGASLNKPVVRKNGEWILPVSLWERWHIDKPFADCYHELDAVRGANIFVSDDEGGHWRYRGGNIFKDSCFNEHSVVEKDDGTLWMLSRCMKEIAQSFSTDGGKTWQEQSTFFPQVNSKAIFRRLQSGHLLLIKHGANFNTPAKDSSEAWNWGKGRSYLTAFLSTDDGKTWPSSLTLDERSPVSYPDIAQTPNGDIYVHYDRDRNKAAEILFARFREEDVQAGKLVTKDAALKNLVKSKLGMHHGADTATSPK